MSRFTRFLRVILLPVAVLAIVAGSSASASAATLEVNVHNAHITVLGHAPVSTKVHHNSMNY